MALSWLKGKRIPAPTDLELELVDALEAVTQCVEANSFCFDVAEESRQTLERAKGQLGIIDIARKG